jgi:hypothetical protein
MRLASILCMERDGDTQLRNDDRWRSLFPVQQPLGSVENHEELESDALEQFCRLLCCADDEDCSVTPQDSEGRIKC